MVDLSNADFWIQVGFYVAAISAGIFYYFRAKKKGEAAPPQLMQLFQSQTSMLMEWFFKAVADGVITKEEAQELKAKFTANLDDTLETILRFYLPTEDVIIEPEPVPVPEPVVVEEPVVEEPEVIDEIASEEPPVEEPVEDTPE